MAKKKDPIESTIPEQEWTRYNRESGKKTLYLVGSMITLVVVLIAVAAVMFFLQ
jgi:hypothetical protein